jgi:hypothetical protein
MENNLIIEINQIRSNMGLSVISENTQIILESPNSAVLETIFNSFFSRTSRSILKTLLSAEEQALIKQYFKNEIKDNATKLKFSNLMKTKGATTIQELKSGLIVAINRGTINDTDAAIFNKFLNKMEKTKTTWSKSLPKTDSIIGKVVKLKDVLTSYFKYVTTIEKKIRDDVASYKYLRDDASKMTIGSEQTLAIKEATRYLDRIELNLGILKRKERESIDAMISQLKQDAALLPKKSPEKIGIEKVITKMESSDATIQSIWKYLPSSYKPEGSVWDEIKRLKKERGERLQGMFGNKIPGWLINKKEGFKPSIGGFTQNFLQTMSGNLGPMFQKMFSNPKLIPRILLTETGSRLMSLPFIFAMIETAYDAILFSTVQNELDIKKYPRISKAIAFTNPDYKNYQDTNWSTDILVDYVTNWFENIGLTIPGKVIIDWMDKNFKSGGLSTWVEQERDLLTNIVEDKNLSPDEKKKKIDEIIVKNKSFLEKTFSFFLGQNEETLTKQINKELSGVDLSNKNTPPTPVPPTPVPPTPAEPSFSGDEKGLTDYLKTLNKDFMPGSYQPAEGEYPAEGLDTEDNIYYFKDNKWKIVTI